MSQEDVWKVRGRDGKVMGSLGDTGVKMVEE